MNSGLLGVFIPGAGIFFILVCFTKGRLRKRFLQLFLLFTLAGILVTCSGLKKGNVTVHRDAKGNMTVREGDTEATVPASPFGK